MDAGLDNANATNNPFANSNGTEILSQKEGFLLNLNDGFKQNGSEISPTNEYLSFERSKNGKRSADEFDEDEDMGPETDIDAVDDISLSPSTEHTTKTISENKVDDSFDPFATDLEDKVTLELDLNLQKQQSSEFDSARTPREETPTPPADEVHDVVGLEENVGDSGEDSEDEWNYYKGDTAEKESISKADQEVAKITEAEENSEAMSQLNPDAAEFVPISSPTRSTASPACRGLINDTVIAQSPRRVTPTEIDINLPNPQEFEKEVKSRPSDVYSNGDDSDSDHKLTSQEVMENLLNGKNIDDIEFHPSTPTKYPNPEEFHFGPNAAPFSTPAKFLDQSETALSTKAVFGEESTASYLEGKSLAFESSFLDTAMSKSFQSEDTQDFQSLNKEQDPMSTSFYQDKSDENDPFDVLNKVQVLPDNDDSDDYLLQKQTVTETLDETISDLPEHNPLDNADVIIETKDKTTPIEVEVNVRQTSPDLLTPDLTEDSSQLASKSPTEELTEDVCSRLSSKSPGILTPEPVDDVCQVPLPKSPTLITPEPTEEVCQLPSKSPVSDVDQLISKSPLSLTPEPAEEVCRVPSKNPEPAANLLSQSPEPTSEVCEVPSKSSAPLTPEPTEEEVCKFSTKSPVALTPEPSEDLYKFSSKSPVALTPEPGEDVCKFSSKSPVALTTEPSEDVCKFSSKSPVALTPEPSDDVCKFSSKSPVALTPEPSEDVSKFSSKSPVALTPDPSEDVCKFSSKSPVALSPEPSEDVCKFSSKSPAVLTPEPTEDFCKIPSKSPVALSPEPTEDFCKIPSKSPVALSPEPTEDVCKFSSKSPVALTPEPAEDICKLSTKSPVAITPEPIEEDVCKIASKSPVALTPEPTENRPSKSPELFEPEIPSKSPAVEESADLLGEDLQEPSKLSEPTEDMYHWSSKSPTALVPEQVEIVCQLSNKTTEPLEDLCQFPIKQSELPAKTQELVQEFTEVAEHPPAKSPELFEEIERKEVFSPEPKAVELECNLPPSKSPVLESPESPMEDITSSVKDDVASSINSPTEEIQQITKEILETGSLNFAQELSSAVQEVVTSPFEEKAPPEPSSPKSELVETESVATADVNSFLERSNLTDMTSPLSPNEPATLLQFDTTYTNDPLAKCVYPLPEVGETLTTKREVIEPEFPIKEIASPAEETPEEVKVEVPKEEAPAASVEANAGDDSKIAEVATAAVAATAVTALAGAAVVAVSSANEKKPAKSTKTTTATTRKSATKPSTSPIKAPSKPATSKPSATSPTKAATTTRVSKTSVSPKAAPSPAKAPLPTKPPVSKPAVPKQRPAVATTKSTEKKAADEKKLVNGDVKSTITRTLHVAAKKTTSSAPNSASKTASAPRTSASAKLSPTKTPTESSKPGSLTRPSTAPGKTATARTTTTAPRARPTSLATKTSTASSSTTTRTNLAVSTTKSTSLTKSSTATSPKTSTAKPRTATTTTVPLHQRTKPTPKGPDTEKQLKETANKQLTASRTTSSTTRSATGKTTTTLQKTETKAPGSRTIATKTTVTTIKSAKKPLEITRNVSKTKTTTTKTTKVEQNGLSNGITITQETTAIISSDPQMIKDLSPVETKLITDNSQLPEANFAD